MDVRKKKKTVHQQASASKQKPISQTPKSKRNQPTGSCSFKKNRAATLKHAGPFLPRGAGRVIIAGNRRQVVEAAGSKTRPDWESSCHAASILPRFAERGMRAVVHT